MAALTQKMREKIYEIAVKLRVSNPEWLVKLIKFESGFDPQAKNPLSSARGLIQIMDKTAEERFGVSGSEELIKKYPDFYSQMDKVVYPYLKKWAPYDSAQSLYMAVFFPAARNVHPSTSFYSLYQKYVRNWQQLYPKFEKANHGIKIVQDYIDYVEGKFRPRSILPLILLTGMGFFIYYYGRKFV